MGYSDIRLSTIKAILKLDTIPHTSLVRFVQCLIRTTDPVADRIPQNKIVSAITQGWVYTSNSRDFFNDRDMCITLVLFDLDIFNLYHINDSPSKNWVGTSALSNLIGSKNQQCFYNALQGPYNQNQESEENIDFTVLLAIAEKYISLKKYQFSETNVAFLNFIFEKLSHFECATKGPKKKIAADKEILNRILTCACECIKAIKGNFKKSSFNLLKKFVQNGHGVDKALQVAVENIEKSPGDSLNALFLFDALIKGKHHIDTVKAICQNNDSDICCTVLPLLEILVNHEYEFDFAVKIAVNNSKHENWEIRSKALELFLTLIEKEQGIAEAMEAAIGNLAHEELQVRSGALQLFKILLGKGYGLDQALNVAVNYSKNDSIDIQLIALTLFKALAAKGHGLKQAQEVADNASKNACKKLKSRAIELLKLLKK